MSASRRVCRWVLAALCVACVPSVTGLPAGFPHSAATPACGPTDGPAVSIYLTSAPVESLEPATPYVRIYVWQSLDRLAGRSWVVAGGEAEAGAWYHRSPSDFEVATSGRVIVMSVTRDNTVEGWVDLRFPSTGSVLGAFRAAWLPRSVLCG